MKNEKIKNQKIKNQKREKEGDPDSRKHQKGQREEGEFVRRSTLNKGQARRSHDESEAKTGKHFLSEVT